MAARADAIRPSGVHKIDDSTALTPHEWDALALERRAGHVELRCPVCLGRFSMRRSIRGTQHFAHMPGESPDCVNRIHEGETAEHRETADLLAADVEAAGWRPEREWRFPGGVADVAAWHPTSRASGAPDSIVEYERKSETLDEYMERDRRRLHALDQGAAERRDIRKTVVWIARQQHHSTYLRLPQLYLSPDGGEVNDGVFHWADTTELGDGTAKPVVIPRTEAIDMALTGRMVRVEGVIAIRGDRWGDITLGDAWLTSRGVKAERRGRRRRAPQMRPFEPHVSDECDRQPQTACGRCGRPMTAWEIEFAGDRCDACNFAIEAVAHPPAGRRWVPCIRCGKPMTAGQVGSHFACRETA